MVVEVTRIFHMPQKQGIFEEVARMSVDGSMLKLPSALKPSILDSDL